MKLDVENNTIVSTLSHVVNINVKIDNVHLKLLNVGLTLSNVATSYHPNNNVETTLKGFVGTDELL